MNVLMVGNGRGSFQIRGVQLGAAMGARVTSDPTAADWRWADMCVLVKNHGARFSPQAHAAGLPVVWDALDFWRQPADNQSDEKRATALLQSHIKAIKPALVVCATQAMADACGGVYVPHHAWPGLEPTPAREQVQTVAYEGNALYLGAWKPALEKACQLRGWTFVVNPPTLADADILVALRDGPWDGWICREWKSGVKAVNAIAAGRPVIMQDIAAWRELQPSGVVIPSPCEKDKAMADLVRSRRSVILDNCLDLCSSAEARRHAAAQVQARALNVQQAAAMYQGMLEKARATCTV